MARSDVDSSTGSGAAGRAQRRPRTRVALARSHLFVVVVPHIGPAATAARSGVSQRSTWIYSPSGAESARLATPCRNAGSARARVHPETRRLTHAPRSRAHAAHTPIRAPESGPIPPAWLSPVPRCAVLSPQGDAFRNHGRRCFSRHRRFRARLTDLSPKAPGQRPGRPTESEVTSQLADEELGQDAAVVEIIADHEMPYGGHVDVGHPLRNLEVIRRAGGKLIQSNVEGGIRRAASEFYP
jgi:hypothetical protein